MNADELKQALLKLQNQLDQADDLDPETEALLRELDQDIHDVLEREEADDEAGVLLERAQELDARFAARHPQLEAVFREVVNVLARMGI
jgi:hypothetical protein